MNENEVLRRISKIWNDIGLYFKGYGTLYPIWAAIEHTNIRDDRSTLCATEPIQA